MVGALVGDVVAANQVPREPAGRDGADDLETSAIPGAGARPDVERSRSRCCSRVPRTGALCRTRTEPSAQRRVGQPKQNIFGTPEKADQLPNAPTTPACPHWSNETVGQIVFR